jgi:hypothetical protein
MTKFLFKKSVDFVLPRALVDPALKRWRPTWNGEAVQADLILFVKLPGAEEHAVMAMHMWCSVSNQLFKSPYFDSDRMNSGNPQTNRTVYAAKGKCQCVQFDSIQMPSVMTAVRSYRDGSMLREMKVNGWYALRSDYRAERDDEDEDEDDVIYKLIQRAYTAAPRQLDALCQNPNGDALRAIELDGSHVASKKHSRFTRKQLGVVSRRKISKGEFLAFYDYGGIVYTDADTVIENQCAESSFEYIVDQEMIVTRGESVVRVVGNPLAAIATLINHSDVPNVRYMSVARKYSDKKVTLHVVVQALVDIEPDIEIVTNYGGNYFSVIDQNFDEVQTFRERVRQVVRDSRYDARGLDDRIAEAFAPEDASRSVQLSSDTEQQTVSSSMTTTCVRDDGQRVQDLETKIREHEATESALRSKVREHEATESALRSKVREHEAELSRHKRARIDMCNTFMSKTEAIKTEVERFKTAFESATVANVQAVHDEFHVRWMRLRDELVVHVQNELESASKS